MTTILDNAPKELIDRKDEWEFIDNLVADYQAQFSDKSEKTKQRADKAAIELINKFYPFIKKYLVLIKTGQINFDDHEQRLFVVLFMDSPELKRALYSKNNIDKNIRALIYQKFNFVKETYGQNEEEEITTDLHILFLTLARRYKSMKKSFCCYVLNAFRYEVFRHIQKFTRNPINIPYRNVSYEGVFDSSNHEILCDDVVSEDDFYTNQMGLPDTTWIQGLSCSDDFSCLTPFERKILVKYYLECYSDKKIAEEFGLHMNTANIDRHKALKKLADHLGIPESEIKRSRNSYRK